MTINIFVLKGELNGENRSGAFLFLSGKLIETLPGCMYKGTRSRIKGSDQSAHHQCLN